MSPEYLTEARQRANILKINGWSSLYELITDLADEIDALQLQLSHSLNLVKAAKATKP